MTPHLKLNSDKRFQRTIVCGSPERASLIAEKLEGNEPLVKSRAYHSFLGKYKGQDILVVSHGVGAAGAAICFQELIDIGTKAIIRIGSAGGLQDHSKIGDIIIATGAIRKDGVSQQMVSLEYPAIPDLEFTIALIENFRKMKISFHTGIVLASDLFYPGLLDPGWTLYKKAGAVAIEMECSALFVIGLLRGIKTAAVLGLDGNPLRWSEGYYDPDSPILRASFEKAIPVALDTLAKIPLTENTP